MIAGVNRPYRTLSQREPSGPDYLRDSDISPAIVPVPQQECGYDFDGKPSPSTRNSNRKRGGSLSASHAGKVYRRRFVPTRFAATLLADGVPCFASFACPALVIKRDCSYISIHFSLEIAEISLPIASSGKSSGDLK